MCLTRLSRLDRFVRLALLVLRGATSASALTLAVATSPFFLGSEPVAMRDPNGGVQVPKKLNYECFTEWGMKYTQAAAKIGTCRIIACFGTFLDTCKSESVGEK